MKRIFAFILALVMVLSLCACGEITVQSETTSAVETVSSDADKIEFIPADAAKTASITEQLQGEWIFNLAAGDITLVFDGNNVTSTASVGGASMSNNGYFEVGTQLIRIHYENGSITDYEYDDSGELTLYMLD